MYLGFVIDSQSMTRSLTIEKIGKIRKIIRKTARLLGKFTGSFPAVRFGTLHYSSLERDKILAIKFIKGNFEKKKESFPGRENGHFLVDK